MTLKEMERQFRELYDNGDDTNPLGPEEYFEEIHDLEQPAIAGDTQEEDGAAQHGQQQAPRRKGR